MEIWIYGFSGFFIFRILCFYVNESILLFVIEEDGGGGGMSMVVGGDGDGDGDGWG